ncbi:hypothetical protein DFH06DRAFT_1171870 [Mycena polygramma]|nr:hypothetical protein DFH06DRAFT_1171870 [Mycena polygramma]
MFLWLWWSFCGVFVVLLRFAMFFLGLRTLKKRRREKRDETRRETRRIARVSFADADAVDRGKRNTREGMADVARRPLRITVPMSTEKKLYPANLPFAAP